MDLKHLDQRKEERVEALIREKKEPRESVLADLFLHASDVGVMRNGGRNGARFAPEAILSVLKKNDLARPVEPEFAITPL